MKRILLFLLTGIVCIHASLFSLDGDLRKKLSALQHRPTVGLVLSGGSAKGFAHIGVLHYLEKEGIRPDYIAGTSMGSIIGSLYALGYSADEIQNIVYSQNWDSIISNRVTYRNTPMSEKTDAGKYFMEFSLKNRKFILPGALIGGQHIMELLNYYEAWQSYGIHDFKKLPIPFFCVAVNLENGKTKIFTEGYLPDAVRASMAIPSVFTPKSIDGVPYIDGGIRDNFPTDLMQKIFHPDIIIGSFTGIRAKKELTTLTNVLTQTMFLSAFDRYQKTKKLCDILIEPDVSSYGLFSFNKYRGIIASGETAAEKKRSEIQLLARFYRKYPPQGKRTAAPVKTSLKFDSITIKGLSHISSSFVRKYLSCTTGKSCTRDSLTSALSKLYGTGYFKYVNYKIIKQGTKNILIIRLKEKSETFFKVGVQYDTEYQAVLPFKFTSLNFLIPNAKLSFSGQLSQNPSAALSYEFFPATMKKLTPAVGISLDASRLNINLYSSDTVLHSFPFNYSLLNLTVYAQSEIAGSLLFEVRAGINYTYINAADLSEVIFQPEIYLKADTRDDPLFPTRGLFFTIRAKYLYNFNPGFDLQESSFPHSVLGRLDGNYSYTLFNRFTIEPSFSLGLSDGINVPLSQYFYLGDITSYPLFGNIPLSPLHHFDLAGSNALALNLSFRYKLSASQFLSLFFSAGNTDNSMENLLNFSAYPAGIGIKYNYNSIIGPVELSALYSTFTGGLLYHLTVGFAQ